MRNLLVAAILLAPVFPAGAYDINSNSLPTFKFEKQPFEPTLFLDYHDATFRDHVVPMFTAQIQNKTYTTVWLEGIPNNIPQDKLPQILDEAAKEKAALFGAKRTADGVYTFDSGQFKLPYVHAVQLDALDSGLRHFDSQSASPEAVEKWHQELKDLSKKLDDAKLEWGFAADGLLIPDQNYMFSSPGLEYYKALKGTGVHFMGMEDGAHYSDYIQTGKADMMVQMLWSMESCKPLISDLKQYADTLDQINPKPAGLQQGINILRRTLKSLDDSFQVFNTEARKKLPALSQAWPPDVKQLWPNDLPALQNRLSRHTNGLLLQRSSDWANFYSIAWKNHQTDGRDLIIGGAIHKDSFVEACNTNKVPVKVINLIKGF